jgi:hypothetical protein
VIDWDSVQNGTLALAVAHKYERQHLRALA